MEMEITAGDLQRPYRVVGPITARVTSLTLLSRRRSIEDVDRKLRQVATEVGANAVVRRQRVVGWHLLEGRTGRGSARGASRRRRTDLVGRPHLAPDPALTRPAPGSVRRSFTPGAPTALQLPSLRSSGAP